MRRLAAGMARICGYKVWDKRVLPWGVNLVEDLRRITAIEAFACALDVGANRGQSLQWMRRAFPRAYIHCFEPVAKTFECLEQAAKGMRDVTCVHAALGAEPQHLLMRVRGEGIGSERNSLVPGTNDPAPGTVEEVVQVETLDRYCAAQGVKEIDFLKIDVEGYELQMLRGADDLLRRRAIRFLFCEAGLLPGRTTQTPLGSLVSHLEDCGYPLLGLYDQQYNHVTARLDFCNALFARASG